LKLPFNLIVRKPATLFFGQPIDNSAKQMFRFREGFSFFCFGVCSHGSSGVAFVLRQCESYTWKALSSTPGNAKSLIFLSFRVTSKDPHPNNFCLLFFDYLDAVSCHPGEECRDGKKKIRFG